MGFDANWPRNSKSVPKIPENIYNGEGNDNPNPEVLHHAAYNEPRKGGLPNEPFKTDEPSWYPWRNKEPGAQIEPKNPKTDWVGKKYGQNTVSIENVWFKWKFNFLVCVYYDMKHVCMMSKWWFKSKKFINLLLMKNGCVQSYNIN